jgi:Tfp pilus assembly protein PilV
VFTRFKARVTRAVASLTAVTLLAGTAAVGFAAPASADEPVVQAEVVEATEAGLKVEVEVTGLPADAGLYSAVIEAGTVESLQDPSSDYVAFALPFPKADAEGAVTFTLDAESAKLDRTKSYEVVVWKQHTAAIPENVYGITGVEVSVAQWDAVFPTVAEPEPVAPSVTVSKTENLVVGETITISGTGFVPNTPDTNGTRPPLSGKFGGAYVVLGKFADVWQPSVAGTSSANRAGAVTRWGVHEEDIASMGSQASSAIAIDENGSFEFDIVVSKGTIAEGAVGNWGVYTYAGGGATYAPFETYTPVTFAPSVTVSKTENLVVGETITISGTGFVPNTPDTNGTRPPLSGKFGGAYVVLGKFADVWQPSVAGTSSANRAGAVTRWGVHEEDIASMGSQASSAIAIDENGSFEFDIVVSKGTIAEGAVGNWGVYTYAGGGGLMHD